jgi:hypothetical protein
MPSTAILSICHYWFWMFFNILSVVELSISFLELLSVHPYRANLGGMRFSNLWCSSLHRVVYQDAVENAEAGWLSQYSIRPWNFEMELTFYLLGLSNYSGMPPKQSGCQTTATSSSKWLSALCWIVFDFLLLVVESLISFFPTQTS